MNAYIQSMIDWIEEHLSNTISLDELAKYIGYSPYYCSFKFHQATGISIRKYVFTQKTVFINRSFSKRTKSD